MFNYTKLVPKLGKMIQQDKAKNWFIENVKESVRVIANHEYKQDVDEEVCKRFRDCLKKTFYTVNVKGRQMYNAEDVIKEVGSLLQAESSKQRQLELLEKYQRVDIKFPMDKKRKRDVETENKNLVKQSGKGGNKNLEGVKSKRLKLTNTETEAETQIQTRSHSIKADAEKEIRLVKEIKLGKEMSLVKEIELKTKNDGERIRTLPCIPYTKSANPRKKQECRDKFIFHVGQHTSQISKDKVRILLLDNQFNMTKQLVHAGYNSKNIVVVECLAEFYNDMVEINQKRQKPLANIVEMYFTEFIQNYQGEKFDVVFYDSQAYLDGNKEFSPSQDILDLFKYGIVNSSCFIAITLSYRQRVKINNFNQNQAATISHLARIARQYSKDFEIGGWDTYNTVFYADFIFTS